MNWLSELIAMQGLCYRGKVVSDSGSTTTHTIAGLAAFGDDFFNDNYYMYINRAGGAAPEDECQRITDYTSATGVFTTVAFTASVEAGDQVVILHKVVYQTFLGVLGNLSATWADGSGAQRGLLDMPFIGTDLAICTCPLVAQDSKEILRYSLQNLRPDSDVIQVGEYASAVVDIDRWRPDWESDWTSVVSGAALTEAAGYATYSYDFPAASWQCGDRIRVTVRGCVVTIGGQTFTLCPQTRFGCVGCALSVHEHVYPQSDGQGAAGAPISIDTDAEDESNAASTTQWYWGEPVELLPPSTVTTAFQFIGAYIYGTTADKALNWHIYPLFTSLNSAKNGGNDWDEGATVLTVADGSIFQTGDLVYISSSAKDGEIMKVTDVSTNVVTVARETSQFVGNNTGLRWNHTTAGDTETMWLCWRDVPYLHGFGGEWSCASSKDFTRIDLHESVSFPANSGLILRAMNQSDGVTASASLKPIYKDVS